MSIIKDQAGNAYSLTNQVPIRGYGVARTANPATYTNGVASDLTITTVGALVAKPYSIPELDWQYAGVAGGIIDTVDKVAKAAGAAGIRNYVTGVDLINVGTVATEFVIKDGATVVWRTFLPANMTTPVDVTFSTPLRGTAATAVNLACITTGAAVYANTQGYQAP